MSHASGMKLAAKQLLALGVPPQEIVALDQHAEEQGMALRDLVQAIVRAWLGGRSTA